MSEGDEARMGILEHLGELRRRLFYALLVIFVATLVCFSRAEQIFEFLRAPLVLMTGNQKLIVLSPLELYVTYIKLAVLAALFISAPWSLLQLWLFIAPGLYAHEKRWVVPFVVLGTLFFIGGAAFAFYLVLPLGFQYMASTMPQTIEANYSVALYFSLITNMMLAFGAVFELPLVMWILSAAGIVNPARYTKLRRYWFIIAFVIAGILTPTPDPLTQAIMAVPLIVFFELGVLGGKILYGRRAAARAQVLEAAAKVEPVEPGAP